MLKQKENDKRKEKDTRKRTMFVWKDDCVDKNHSVLLAGSFTNWQAIAMHRGKDNFISTVPLDPGTYTYKFVVDGIWKCSPDEPTQTDADGNVNNVIHVKKTGPPKVQVKKQKTENSNKNKQKEHTVVEDKNLREKKINTAEVVDKKNDDVNNSEEKSTQIVDPWTAEGGKDGIDYIRLVNDFGTNLVEESLLERFEKVSGHKVHPWLRRGLFYSHRSLNEILDNVEKGIPFYLYTGRGPSSEALHLGHMIPFMLTKWLQDVFDVPLVIQLTDDEKFLWKDISLETCQRLAIENAKDIIACGFDIKKTFIFRDTDYIGHMFCNVVKIQKCVTANQVKAIFGFDGSCNIGKYMYPAIQAAPSFSSSFPHIFGEDSNYPCLIPCAIDQDPFFRMTRDIAPRLNFLKPAVLHSKFFPALQGPKTKMSASTSASAIFMTDTKNQIMEKVMEHSFSGGRATLKEHRELGGDLNVDVPYQYLKVFLFDDEKLKYIGDEFSSGKMTSAEIKSELVEVLAPFVLKHQEARILVTDDVVLNFMKIRPLEFKFAKK